MPKKIAVEQDLTQVQQYLNEKGYEVVGMDQLDQCDCCVVSGVDQNMMGMHDVQTKVPVIDARGMSAEEVGNAIDSRL